MGFLKKFWASEKGNSMVEYSMLIALIAMALIPALTSLGCGLNWTFNRAGWVLRKAADRG